MKQCKSYDERMKQENFEKKGKDIPQYVTEEIRKYREKDPEIGKMLERYKEVRQEKSAHMEFLKEESKLDAILRDQVMMIQSSLR